MDKCRVGDIIVIDNYKSHGVNLGRHSFVVLSTECGKIHGLDYDIVCNVMSSFHSEEHRQKKLRYPGNFEYPANQEMIKNRNGKSGFIKADQFYYFEQDKIDFYVIGNVHPSLFNSLLEFIAGLDEIEDITDNLS